MAPATQYLVRCPNCTAEHDAVQAIWCSCDPQDPSKLCPFCFTCFCRAEPEYREEFWRDAPPVLQEERATLRESRMLLGDMMVRAGVITTDQLVAALQEQQQAGGRIGDVLIRLGFLTRDRMERFLKMQHSVVRFDVQRVVLDVALVRQIGVEFCRRKRILPLEKESFRDRSLLTLAMANPADTETVNRVQRMSDCQILTGRAGEEEILAALQSHFPEPVHRTATAVSERPGGTADEMIRLAERLLRTGLERGADEIRIREEAQGLQVHYRIAGRSYRAGCPDGTDASALLARLRDLLGVEAGTSGESRFPFAGGEVRLMVAAEPSGRGGGLTVRLDG